jgi:hypothetical protein
MPSFQKCSQMLNAKRR